MKRLKTYSQLQPLLLLVVCAAGFVSAQDRTLNPSQISAFGGTGFGSGAAGPIGAGDLLEMSVFDTPELSGKLRVSNTGDILLPLIGSINVQGLKAEQGQNLIRQKFIDGGFLKDPQVTLFIAEYATQGVSVLGEVKSPGIYPAFGSHHLLDYISVSQGLTPLAGTRVTITHAGKPDEPQRVKVTTGATPKPENNPEVFPGDTIFVERTGIVYVIGDVVRPGGFPMDHDEQLTVLQAVALAQGATPTAAKGSARLIRTTTQGRQEIPVNLKRMLSSKDTDLALQDNDILFVPSSTAKNVFKNVESIAPAAAAATIYRIP